MPGLPQLRVEAVEALIAADRLPEAMTLARAAPPSSFAGRFRFLEARAALLDGDAGRARTILAGGLEVAGLREGEVSLSDLWLAVHRAPPGAAGAQPDVPFVYDFRLDGGAARP
jgi:hypothetical protein